MGERLAKIIHFPTRQDREDAVEKDLEQELFALDWSINALYAQIEVRERRREDVKRALGLLGIERGLEDDDA